MKSRVPAVSVIVAFAVAVAANSETRNLFTIAAVLVAGALGVLVTQRITGRRVLAMIGLLVAVAAAWLLPQRDDAGAAIILAFLFASGAGLAVQWRPARRDALSELAASVVWIVLGILTSQVVVLVGALVIVLVATLVRPRAQPAVQRTGRASVFGVVLVVVTVLFAGYVGAETPGATWFGGGVTHGPTDTRQVALTFDDGPDRASTPEIMRILDRYGVKATFFEVGKAIDAAPEVTGALFRDDQLLGNHSYHHDNWSWLNPSYPELQETQDAFKRAIGSCPVLFRPPHGQRTPFLARVVHDHDMHMVLWNVSSADWSSNDPQAVADRTLKDARPGSIILLHDGLDGNPDEPRPVIVQALPKILDGLRAKHLEPVRLDVMLGTPAYQPCN